MFEYLFDFLNKTFLSLNSLWTWLITPLNFKIFDFLKVIPWFNTISDIVTTPLSLFGIGFISVVFILKLVKLIPLA